MTSELGCSEFIILGLDIHIEENQVSAKKLGKYTKHINKR